jgi:hypothetical protein
MATGQGYNGSVTWAVANANNAVNVFNYTFDEVTDALEITDFSSTGDRRYIPGLTGRTGSFDVYLDNVAALPAAGLAATEMVFTIVIGAATVTITYDAFRTGLSLGNSVDGVPTVTVSFQVDDDVVIAVA